MTDLRAMRKRLGLTQAQLAAALSVSRKCIIERERGQVPITRETALAMTALVLWQDGIADPVARAELERIMPPQYR